MITQPPSKGQQYEPPFESQTMKNRNWNSQSHSQSQHKQQPIHKKQCEIKIHDLQVYVSSIFNGCSMPPLNQLLELEMIAQEESPTLSHSHHQQQKNQSCRVRLSNYKKQKFVQEQENRGAYIYYLFSGKLILKKVSIASNNEDNQSRSTSRIISASRISSGKIDHVEPVLKDRGIEVKQGNFFMLVNIKKAKQIEPLYISSHQNGEHNRCLIGKIKVSSVYNINWYISESEKHQFLAPFFQSSDYSISQHKLKGLSRFFKYENFRRGTLVCQEGQQNERLCFIKSGECQFSKNMSYNQKNHSNLKTLKVANGGPRAVFGAQFLFYDFLGCSKQISIATRAMAELENQNERLNFRMDSKNINNFTVTVLSSYAEIYFISVTKFKQLCEKYVQEGPQQLRKNIEGNYITLLRTTKQKLTLQVTKMQRNEDKSNEQKLLVEAKLKSGYFDNELNNLDIIEEKSRNSPIRIRKSELLETNLQQAEVQRTRTKRLEKKIQLLLEQKKANVNYKKKIQIVLKQKLHPSPISESPLLVMHDLEKQTTKSPSPSPAQVQQIKKDLQNIFENKDDAYRSNHIERQQEMLKTKQSMLKKRYSSVDNVLIVHKDHYDREKNKLFRMDLIQRGIIDSNEVQKNKNFTGMQIQSFSNRVKKQCIEKINKANKIKEQFMTIRSQCEKCHCYDDIQGYIGNSHKDIKMQAMKTGSAWRTSCQSRNQNYEQPLEKLHSRTKLISEKASRKYEHNVHLHSKRKRFISGSQRRLSAALK